VRLDHQVGQVARAPQQPREHDQPDGVAHQQPDPRAAGRAVEPPRRELPQRQHQDHHRRDPEKDADQ
jgi:hypothetical protein